MPIYNMYTPSLASIFAGVFLLCGYLVPRGADCLSCYQCNSTGSLENCQVVTCQQGEVCFVGSRLSTNGAKISTFRCEQQLCTDPVVGLVGRAIDDDTQPWEGVHCCGEDLCNGHISSCQDDPNINCALLKNAVCPSPVTARQICQRTCNLCDSAVHPTTTQARTTITPTSVHSETVSAPTTTAAETPAATTATATPAATTATAAATTATATPAAVWLDWSPYDCQTIDGICFAIRQRVCSTKVASDCQGIDYDSELCSDRLCHVVPVCEDARGFNCESIKDVACSDGDLVHNCNRTCGLCGPVTPTCQDSPGFDCEKIKDVVCLDGDLVHNCNKTCGICGRTTTMSSAAGTTPSTRLPDSKLTPPVSTASSTSPTTHIPAGNVTSMCQDTPGFNCEPIKDVVCPDPELVHNCNRTCGICDTCIDMLPRCGDPDFVAVVCGDTDFAVKYCAKTCKTC